MICEMITTIKNVFELGLTEPNWNVENDEIVLQTVSYSLRYENRTFWSYDEIIAETIINENNSFYLKIYPKTAKYNDFHSRGISNHITLLLSFVNDMKITHELIDKHGNKIGKFEDTGKMKVQKFECPICLDEKYVGTMLRCNHIFCPKCIKKWLKKEKLCPMCRKSVYYNEKITEV